MTYTTEQLQAMSDFERNKAVAMKLYPNASIFKSMTDDSSITIKTDEFTKVLVDYCNNPSDIMPLAFERCVSLIKVDDGRLEWVACANVDINHGDISYDTEYHDTNPLRAIACVILMMEG